MKPIYKLAFTCLALLTLNAAYAANHTLVAATSNLEYLSITADAVCPQEVLPITIHANGPKESVKAFVSYIKKNRISGCAIFVRTITNANPKSIKL